MYIHFGTKGYLLARTHFCTINYSLNQLQFKRGRNLMKTIDFIRINFLKMWRKCFHVCRSEKWKGDINKKPIAIKSIAEANWKGGWIVRFLFVSLAANAIFYRICCLLEGTRNIHTMQNSNDFSLSDPLNCINKLRILCVFLSCALDYNLMLSRLNSVATKRNFSKTQPITNEYVKNIVACKRETENRIEPVTRSIAMQTH